LGLDKVLGQDKQIEYLRKLLEKRNIPSTLLFVGPKGVGKFLLPFNLQKPLIVRLNPLMVVTNANRVLRLITNFTQTLK